MDWDRRRFDDRRGGESYRPAERPGRSPSRGYENRRRSPPRNRSRPRADTWVPSNRTYGRPRSRSPEYRRRSRTPPFQGRGYGPGSYGRRRSPPRRFSPRRDDRIRSPPPSWRSRSPGYHEGRPRDLSRGRDSPRRARDPTPASQDHRATRRISSALAENDRPAQAISSDTQPALAFRPQGSTDAYHQEKSALKRERPLSPSRQSPAHIAAAPEISATSRRSSPSTNPERSGVASIRSHSRSPMRQSPSLRPPSGPRSRSPYRDLHRESEPLGPRRSQDDQARTSEKAPAEPGQISGGRSPANIPTQPRNAGIRQPPPSGPSQGSSMAAPGPGRGPHNMSLLSAPTRPRRGPGSREGPWGGSPMARRGPPSTPAVHGVPSGPRASFSSPVPGGGAHYRHASARQHSAASANSPTGPKPPSHLAGLSAIIPGGRAFPSTLDPATEKRLLQLESDREKILEQVMETQKIKRAGLRDWDRLDRESSICALKSELAEGHLQRMAEENSIGGGVLF